MEDFVRARVEKYYREDDTHCTAATLKILSEALEIELNQQTFDAALGMHGAGGYGAQCGLVEGALMFLGIYGRINRFTDEKIAEICREYARQFEGKFTSLLCSVLRPEGFKPDNPPHICEVLSIKATEFTINYILKLM